MAKVLCKKCNMVSEYHFTDLNGKIESEIICDVCLPEAENHHIKNLSMCATPDNKMVASYSKYGFIEKFDHEEGSLIEMTNDKGGKIFVLNPTYSAMHDSFKRKFKLDDNSIHLYKNEYGDIYSILYMLYMEEPENFDHVYYGVEELEEHTDTWSAWLVVSDSLKETIKVTPKSMVYNLFSIIAKRHESSELKDCMSLLYDIYEQDLTNKFSKNYRSIEEEMKFSLMDMFNKKPKPNWRDKQSKEDKEKRLKAAEEKRQKKLTKRRK